jgi:tRNA U34 5-methylaminomethyl-2-thiouridine-forming methyltransferase MnmC
MKHKIILTEDGSHSLFVEELDETYHSVHGAWNESLHVFIENGYKKMKPEGELNILEIGFGTGLNVLQTAHQSEFDKRKVYIETLEAFPIPVEEHRKLNYSSIIKEKWKVETDYFLPIVDASWNKDIVIHPFFTFNKKEERLQDWLVKDRFFDCIYFDAFAPNKQDDMWSEELFKKMFLSLKPNGLLTTYCAKGSVKRMLKTVGFTIENVPGPPGKREMTLAWKK